MPVAAYYAIENGPGYWMNETSGVLRPAVLAYLSGGEMTGPEIAAMRAYLRQWIASPMWMGPDIDKLRHDIESLTTHDALVAWMRLARDNDIDPI